ncbi:hypothetical protein CCACVL1_00686 [Corchorus capsularis]|uniref:Uncharacterized protein n=1 Tax=Corchorus capsularis TaxID=210143 RepID=A0A1R3KVG3_COCAP|nr:hypothetical protein CCACVL1_00686 [Corchorus capsularis]
MEVGIVGNDDGRLGRGGRVTLGALGMVGNVGMLASGGRDGNEGIAGCGRFGIDGNGGSFPVGIGGKGGSCCRRWRPASPPLMLEIDKATKNATTKQLKEAMSRGFKLTTTFC